jgi:hypothetical protein
MRRDIAIGIALLGLAVMPYQSHAVTTHECRQPSNISLPQERQDRILGAYGLPAGTHPDYVIGRYIPDCLGGSDDDDNLWPQPRASIVLYGASAEAKAELDRVLCRAVCRKQMTRAEALRRIEIEWPRALTIDNHTRPGPAEWELPKNREIWPK